MYSNLLTQVTQERDRLNQIIEILQPNGTSVTAPKRRGRPPGSTNITSAVMEPRIKRARKAAVRSTARSIAQKARWAKRKATPTPMAAVAGDVATQPAEAVI